MRIDIVTNTAEAVVNVLAAVHDLLKHAKATAPAKPGVTEGKFTIEFSLDKGKGGMPTVDFGADNAAIIPEFVGKIKTQFGIEE